METEPKMVTVEAISHNVALGDEREINGAVYRIVNGERTKISDAERAEVTEDLAKFLVGRDQVKIVK
jgi:hypothetical protein